jgi:hypothetical protein
MYDAESVWVLTVSTFIFLFRTAIRLPEIGPESSTGSKNQNHYFYPPTTPGNFCFGIGDEAHVFWPSSTHPGRSPPARRDFASDISYYI